MLYVYSWRQNWRMFESFLSVEYLLILMYQPNVPRTSFQLMCENSETSVYIQESSENKYQIPSNKSLFDQLDWIEFVVLLTILTCLAYSFNFVQEYWKQRSLSCVLNMSLIAFIKLPLKANYKYWSYPYHPWLGTELYYITYNVAEINYIEIEILHVKCVVNRKVVNTHNTYLCTGIDSKKCTKRYV